MRCPSPVGGGLLVGMRSMQQYLLHFHLMFPYTVCKHSRDRTPVKLTRKALEEAANTMPLSHILGKRVSDGLTPKQRKFAMEVAKGATKADAYRASYDVNSQHTITRAPYMLMRDERIQKEIDAYALALEAAKHRSPAALRSLVIQTLTQVLIDPDTKPAVRINAAKVLGTVTEVAAFTERREVRNITSSEDARTKVMAELRGLLTAGATDATIIEADSLMAELTGETGQDENATGASADPPYPDPPLHDSGVPPP